MADLPSGVLYGTVVGQFIQAVVDASDPNREPDKLPMSGSITIAPTAPRVRLPFADPNPVTMFQRSFTLSLDEQGYLISPDGQQGVRLIASDSPGDPTGFTYTASVDLNGVAPFSFSFFLPAGTVLDLTTAIPADPNGGTIVTTDGLVATLVNDEDSETRQALNTTIDAVVPIAAASVVAEAQRVAAAGGVLTTHDVPAGLSFGTDFPLAPTLTAYPDGTVVGSPGITPAALFDAFSTARSAPTATYYVSPAGNDANDGLSSAAAFRSISAAITAANTGGVPARVNVAAGDYLMGQAFNAVSPTVDIAFVLTGGTARVGMLYNYATAFAVSSTYANAYFINTSGTWAGGTGGVTRVIDLLREAPEGLNEELTRVDETVVNNTPGSYYQGTLAGGGSALLIRRKDGQQPTAANTLIIRSLRNFYVGGPVNVFVGTTDGSEWEMYGCDNSHAFMDTGSIMLWQQNPTAARKAAVFERVRTDYSGRERASGGSTSIGNGVSVQKWNGIAAFFNCSAVGAAKDGFNIHNSIGNGSPAAKPILLTVNCDGTDSGRGLNTSCNGGTNHEDAIWVDIASRFARGRGGTVRNVGSSKTLLVGTLIENDIGDIEQGGTTTPVAVLSEGTSQTWCDRTRVHMPRGKRAYATGDTGVIRRRNTVPVRQPDLGTVTTY